MSNRTVGSCGDCRGWIPAFAGMTPRVLDGRCHARADDTLTVGDFNDEDVSVNEDVADTGRRQGPPSSSSPRRAEGTLTAGTRSPLDWDLVRIDFEGDEKTSWRICREYGIPPAELARHARKAKWNTKHRDAGLDRTILIQLLFGILDREIGKLEKSEMSETTDRVASGLGRLATSMERLIELENRAGTGSTPEQTKEMQDIRRKLARRIDRLAKR
jgi:hypothetical protein